MSGIAGIVAGRQHPVDRELLNRLTESLVFRGPDRTGQWYSAEAGLGHTLLATTFEASNEQQPITFDGRYYLTADCRIDDRERLRRQLERNGRTEVKTADDAQLILHAFHMWGDRCVDYLLGDFAFAIWDVTRRRLFCARDQSGIKPFYYAMPDGEFLFSNTLNTIRLHPGVSARLDELAIVDFLMIGENQEPDTTIFSAIKALAPAHVLVWEDGQLALRRYWERPVDELIRFRRPADYVERLNELLDAAIADRIRTPAVAIQMSGGVDSTLLAARARRVGSGTLKVSAYSIYYDSLIPDTEQRYAKLAAEHIGIPIQFFRADGYTPFQNGAALAAGRPEPELAPEAQMLLDFRRQMANHSRVCFYGEGPDNLLIYEWRAYLRYLRNEGLAADTVRAVLHSAFVDPRIPFSYSRRSKLSAEASTDPAFPSHLRPEVVRRFGLESRWQDIWGDAKGRHPYHPRAHGSMSRPAWLRIFRDADAGVNGILQETRHPFLDLRVARYLLALPVVPWCRRKLIIRSACRQVLPTAIWERDKTPLAGDSLTAQKELGHLSEIPSEALKDFAEYVTHWPRVESGSEWDTLLGTIPLALGQWWQAQKSKQ